MEHVLSGITLISLSQQKMGLVNKNNVRLALRSVRNATTVRLLFTEFVDELAWLEHHFIRLLLQSKFGCDLVIDMHLLLMVDENIRLSSIDYIERRTTVLHEQIFIVLIIKMPIDAELRRYAVEQVAQ